MIVNSAQVAVHRGGEVMESRFSIQASGTAFKILSDGLYSNKIEAVIRELCCNAWDAHVAAGRTEVPFYIHLPTSQEPFFRVQDFGIGLSIFQAQGGMVERTIPAGTVLADGSVAQQDFVIHEFVGGIFNTYFKSTKTESNDYIGALGLGSKSPFSYVDSYTVVSVKDGEKHSFSVFINEFGEPAIALLDTQPTDEHNGVEITMPVREIDFTTFSNTARRVLEWFPVAPKTNNYLIPNTREYSLTGDGWALDSRSKSYGYYEAAKAVMGNIAYPISNSIKGLEEPKYQSLLRAPFVLSFPNGDLEFAASRESLSYTQKTIKAIKSRLDEILAILPQKAQTELDLCATTWDAHQFYHKNVVEGPLFQFKDLFQLKFRGKVINDSNIRLDGASLGGATVSFFTSKGQTKKLVANRDGDSSILKIPASDGIVIYIDDVTRGGVQRLKKQYPGNLAKVRVFNFDSVDGLAYLEKTLEGFPFKLISSIEVPKKARSPRAVAPKGLVMSSTKYTRNRNGDELFVPDTSTMDYSQGGMYCEVYRGAPVSSGGRSMDRIHTLMCKAANLGIIPGDWEVLGFKPAELAKAQKAGTWEHAYDVIVREFKKLVALYSDELETLAVINWYHNDYQRAVFIQRVKSHTNMPPALQNLIDMIGAIEVAPTVSNIRDLANELNITLPTSNRVPVLQNAWNQIIAKYPLLTMARLTTETRVFLDYMDQLDRLAALEAK